jgi:hypothetical protein
MASTARVEKLPVADIEIDRTDHKIMWLFWNQARFHLQEVAKDSTRTIRKKKMTFDITYKY